MFSPEQTEIIESWGSGMAVMAGAGSGKTTTLVAKCVRLMELHPDARFVAVSFTERSTSDLKVRLAGVLPKANQMHWITTIHGLCASIIREYPSESGFTGEEIILAESEAASLWGQVLDSIWMDDIPDAVRVSIELLLDRESKDSLAGLLSRVRDLSGLGVFPFLEASSDPATSALKEVAKYVLERYSRLKDRQGYLDFSDLEAGATRALEVQSVCEAYHSRFKLVLVDEFQDTNPLQARLIRKFAKPDASNLCVVGDPKQSIYRFRDADVTVFEEFCQQLSLQKSLTWNFRSAGEIIGFTNTICEKLFSASQMRFEALIPKRAHGSDSVVRVQVQNPFELGQWLRGEVDRGAKLSDFALLLRKVRGNERWLKALNASGIPIALGSGGLFWEDPRVRELIAFLKWWDSPANSLSGAVFLRSPWVSQHPFEGSGHLTDVKIDHWIKEDPYLWKPFFESSHPFAKVLKPYVGKPIRPGDLLLVLMSGAEQETEAELGASLLGLWHRVEELSSSGMSFHEVVVELSSAVKESRREREVPSPRGLDQLRVLTLHGAKGLEFSKVILVDFATSFRGPDAPLLYWDRNDGAFLAPRDEDGTRDRSDPGEKKWRELERKRNLAESKRLFYVALTRAKDHLFLVCQSEDSVLSKEGASPYLRDDWRAWIDQFPELKSVQVENDNSGTVTKATTRAASSVTCVTPLLGPRTQVPEQRKKRPRHSVTEWSLLSRCPRAYEWTYVSPKPVDSLESDEEIGEVSPVDSAVAQMELPFGRPVEMGLKDTSYAAETIAPPLDSEELLLTLQRNQFQDLGNRVHRFLATGDLEGLRSLENDPTVGDFSAAPLIQWVQSSPWMKPGAINLRRDVWTELPFEVPVGEDVLVGSIDRVVREDEKFTVIDFKVTERFKTTASLLEAYRTQIDLYATALQILDPQIQFKNIDAKLVNITKGGVQIVSVRLKGEFQSVGIFELAREADEILNGSVGTPRTGPLCRFCDFRSQCPEGLLA